MIESNAKQEGKKLREFGKSFTNHSKDIPREKRKALYAFGLRVKASILYSMRNDPKTGRLYKVGGKYHRASAPGESPAVLTGDLIKSIGYSRRKNEIEIGAKNSVDYGKFLEQGTAKMEERPYLMVNVNSHMDFLKSQILKRVAEIKIHKGAGWYT